MGHYHLQALRRAFDDNGDGVLDARDSVWEELRVWQDLDQDGETDPGELNDLEHWGIASISLGYDDGSAYGDPENDISIGGVTVHGFASFVMDGETVEGGVGDVTLSFDELGWRRVGERVEFESGATTRHAVLDGTGSADVDLAAMNLDGAVGDARGNVLRATGHVVSARISGGDGDDAVYGGEAADVLSGDSGADTLVGGDGDDMVFMDADDALVLGQGGVDAAIVMEFDEYGEDGELVSAARGVSLDMGATGFESARGGDGDDRLFVDASFGTAISVSAGGGDDTVVGGAQDDALSGDGGNDLLSGNGGDDHLDGGSGDDFLDGGAGDDFLAGGFGDDSLAGGTGDDLLSGGFGDDRMDGGTGDDVLAGGAGKDSLAGGSGDDLLDGGSGDDVLDGGDGDDALIGGSGNDTIRVGGGDNLAVGGAGDDHFHVSNRAARDDVFGGTGTDRLHLEGSRSDYVFEYVGAGEGTTPRHAGGSRSRRVDEDGEKGVNQYLVRGPDGLVIRVQDVEEVRFGDGEVMRLENRDPAADNSATFVSEAAEDDIASRGGRGHFVVADQYGSSSWADLLTRHFGAGDDSIRTTRHVRDLLDLDMGGGDDVAGLGKGRGSVEGSSGDDRLAGGSYGDTLVGGSGSDALWGEGGHDSLDGGSGADRLEGGSGRDTLDGGTGGDLLLGGADADLIRGGYGADSIHGGSHDDTLRGDGGGYLVDGGSGADSIDGGDGGDGDDVLGGGEGNDTVLGGKGDDHLDGAKGSDTLSAGCATIRSLAARASTSSARF